MNNLVDQKIAVVLLFRNGSIEHDLEFYSELDRELAKRGLSLAVISDHRPAGAHFGWFKYQFIERFQNYALLNSAKQYLVVAKHERYHTREKLYYGSVEESKAHEGAIWCEQIYRDILSELNPSYVLLWNGQHGSEMLIHDLLHEYGLRHSIVERGPLPGTLHWDEEGGTAASDASAKKTCSWYDVPSWLEVFDQYENTYLQSGCSWHSQPKDDDCDGVYERMSNSKMTVLWLSQLDNDTSNFLHAPHHASNLEAFEWFCGQLFELNPDVFLVGKHHPLSKSSVDSYRLILGDRGVYAADLDIRRCMECSDRVVAVNSTALYEALMYRKPILQIGRSILSGKGVAYEIENLETANAVVCEWLHAKDNAERILRWRELGASLLSDCLYVVDERYNGKGANGADALANRLNNVADHARIKRGEPVLYDLHEQLREDHKRLFSVGELNAIPVGRLSAGLSFTVLLHIIRAKIENRFGLLFSGRVKSA